MDFKRNVLIAGLAVVSYLLLLAWNEDYPAQQLQQAPETTTSSIEGLPDIQSTSNESNDIPQVNVTNNTLDPVLENTNQSSNYITVTTPVHVVSIDLTGGDIVELSLPKYPVSLDRPDEPFILLKNDNSGVYIAQSGLVGKGPDANQAGRPIYKTEQSNYVLAENREELTVDLSFSTAEGVSITKRFTFSSSDYLIGVEYLIDNKSQESWSGNIFGQIKRDNASDPSSTSGMGMGTFLGAVLTLPSDPYKRLDFDDMDDENLDVENIGGWIGFGQHYFLTSWIPNSETKNSYSTKKSAANEYIIGFYSPETQVAAGENQSIAIDFWAGPKDQYRLEEISPNLGLTIDYGFLAFVAQPIFWLITQINDVIGNFGWSIIAMTIVIKILFSYFSAISYTSQAKMKRLAPKIAQLKDRYGDDKQKIMQEQMALWKKEKVNPLGGCLPMLLQMPVLMGIYWVLNESVELRQAPFLLWYDDLSMPDQFFILPLIMGLTMFISQTMTGATAADPMQAKVMKFMPVIFTVFFLWFPSGLVLYWLVGNICNIVQQAYIIRKVNASYEKKTN